MNLSPKLRGPYSFAIVVGLTDGILNALTLAAGHFVTGSRPSLMLALHIALGSALCGVFIFFTAEYARLRSELLEFERQLNLTSKGRLATTSLGKQVRKEAMFSGAVSSAANFAGALIPLMLGATVHGAAVFAIVPAIIALGMLGAILAWSIRGSVWRWTLVLMSSGVLFSALGIWLHIA